MRRDAVLSIIRCSLLLKNPENILWKVWRSRDRVCCRYCHLSYEKGSNLRLYGYG